MADIRMGAELDLNVTGVQTGSQKAVSSLEAIQAEMVKTQAALATATDGSSLDRLGQKLVNLQANFNALNTGSGASGLAAPLKAASAAGQELGTTMIGVGDNSRALSQLMNRNLHGVAELFISPSRAALILANDMPQMISRFRELSAANAEVAANGGKAVSTSTLLKQAFDPLNLAIGLGTIALIKFLPKLIDYITKSSDAVDATKTLSDALSKDSGYKKAIENVSKLTEDIKLAKDGFISKSGVVKEYNNTIGKTTGLVKNVDEAESALVKNKDAYIKMMAQKAGATYAYGEAAKAAVDAQLAALKSAQTPSFGDFAKAAFFGAGSGGVMGQYFKDINDDVDDANKKADQLNKIGDTFEAAAAKISKAFNFNFESDTKAKKGKTAAEKLADELKLISNEKESLDEKFKNGVINNVQYSTQLINLLTKSIDELHNRFNQPFDSKAITELQAELTHAIALKPIDLSSLKATGSGAKLLGEQMAAVYKEANAIAIKEYKNAGKEDIFSDLDTERANLVRQLRSAGIFNIKNDQGVIVPVSLKVDTQSLKNATKEIGEITKLIQRELINATENIAEGIGTAIGSGGGMSGIFDSFKNSLGQAIEDFGKWVIEKAIVIKALKESIESWIVANPGIAIAAGIALVALGAAMKASMNQRGGTSSSGSSSTPYYTPQQNYYNPAPSSNYSGANVSASAIPQTNGGMAAAMSKGLAAIPVNVTVDGQIKNDVIRLANINAIRNYNR